jgi:hypothetical protein
MAAIRTSRRKRGRGQRRPNSGCIRRGCSMRLSLRLRRESRNPEVLPRRYLSDLPSMAGACSDRVRIVQIAVEISLACETR